MSTHERQRASAVETASPVAGGRRWTPIRWCTILGVALVVALGSPPAVHGQEAGSAVDGRELAPSDGVAVVIRNKSAWHITVRAVRFGSLVTFDRRIPPNQVHQIVLPHAVFGSSPVAFELLRGPVRLADHYEVDGRLRVPGQSVVWMDIPEDIRDVTVRVMKAPRVASTSGTP